MSRKLRQWYYNCRHQWRHHHCHCYHHFHRQRRDLGQFYLTIELVQIPVFFLKLRVARQKDQIKESMRHLIDELSKQVESSLWRRQSTHTMQQKCCESSIIIKKCLVPISSTSQREIDMKWLDTVISRESIPNFRHSDISKSGWWHLSWNFPEQKNHSKGMNRLFQRSIEEYDRKNGQNKQKHFHIRPINGLIYCPQQGPVSRKSRNFLGAFRVT